MRFGRIGGMLIVGGVALFVFGYALLIVGAVVGNLVTGCAMALIGSGAAILCATGPAPLHGRVIRAGLGVLAVGLGSLLASSIVASTLTYDPLESWPVVVLGLGGFLALALGSLMAEASLLRTSGPPRAVGSFLIAGPLLSLLAGIISANVSDVPLVSALTGALVILGAAGFLLGCAGIGLLVIKDDGSVPAGAT
jgi:hypothetical protein